MGDDGLTFKFTGNVPKYTTTLPPQEPGTTNWNIPTWDIQTNAMSTTYIGDKSDGLINLVGTTDTWKLYMDRMCNIVFPVLICASKPGALPNSINSGDIAFNTFTDEAVDNIFKMLVAPFKSPNKERVLEKLQAHFEQYRNTPDEVFEDEVIKILKGEKSATNVKRVIGESPGATTLLRVCLVVLLVSYADARVVEWSLWNYFPDFSSVNATTKTLTGVAVPHIVQDFDGGKKVVAEGLLVPFSDHDKANTADALGYLSGQIAHVCALSSGALWVASGAATFIPGGQPLVPFLVAASAMTGAVAAQAGVVAVGSNVVNAGLRTVGHFGGKELPKGLTDFAINKGLDITTKAALTYTVNQITKAVREKYVEVVETSVGTTGSITEDVHGSVHNQPRVNSSGSSGSEGAGRPLVPRNSGQPSSSSSGRGPPPPSRLNSSGTTPRPPLVSGATVTPIGEKPPSWGSGATINRRNSVANSRPPSSSVLSGSRPTTRSSMKGTRAKVRSNVVPRSVRINNVAAVNMDGETTKVVADESGTRRSYYIARNPKTGKIGWERHQNSPLGISSDPRALALAQAQDAVEGHKIPSKAEAFKEAVASGEIHYPNFGARNTYDNLVKETLQFQYKAGTRRAGPNIFENPTMASVHLSNAARARGKIAATTAVQIAEEAARAATKAAANAAAARGARIAANSVAKAAAAAAKPLPPPVTPPYNPHSLKGFMGLAAAAAAGAGAGAGTAPLTQLGPSSSYVSQPYVPQLAPYPIYNKGGRRTIRKTNKSRKQRRTSESTFKIKKRTHRNRAKKHTKRN